MNCSSFIGKVDHYFVEINEHLLVSFYHRFSIGGEIFIIIIIEIKQRTSKKSHSTQLK